MTSTEREPSLLPKPRDTEQIKAEGFGLKLRMWRGLEPSPIIFRVPVTESTSMKTLGLSSKAAFPLASHRSLLLR